MRAFEDEMPDYKEEVRAQNREMNLLWAEIADKMGTLAEDVIASKLPGVVRELFGCEAIDFSVMRVRKKWQGEIRPYDLIVVSPSVTTVFTSCPRPSSTVKSLTGRFSSSLIFMPTMGQAAPEDLPRQRRRRRR
jgi:hypothetical protein